MSSTVTRKYEGIQALRFLAAFLVVVTHATFYVHERLEPSFPVWKIGGIMGVDIFFVISGFVMLIASRDRHGRLVSGGYFLLRRAMRILPLYWLATALNVVILLALPAAVLHSHLDVPVIIKSFLLIPTHNSDGRVEPLVGVGWTLYFEFFFYFIFALALFLRANVYLVVGGVLSIFAFGSIFKTVNDPAFLVLFDPIVLEFFAGMLIARYGRVLDVRPVAAFAIIAGGLAFGFSIHSIAPDLPILITRILPAAAVVGGVVLAERSLAHTMPKWILSLGAASYAIYLFHPIVSAAVPFAFAKIGLMNPFMAFVCAVIAGVVIPTYIYRFVEIPVLRKAGLVH